MWLRNRHRCGGVHRQAERGGEVRCRGRIFNTREKNAPRAELGRGLGVARKGKKRVNRGEVRLCKYEIFYKLAENGLRH